MPNVIADFVDSGRSQSGDPSAILAKSTEEAVVSSSDHSTLAPPQKNNNGNFVEIQRAQQNNQRLAHELIPGGTFTVARSISPYISQAAVPNKTLKS